MKAVEKTIVVLAFLALLSQAIRHAYMLWLEPRDSVLDKYDRPIKGEIAAAKSLDELVRRYEPVRKQVDEAKQQQSQMGPAGLHMDAKQAELFKSEMELHEAINDWEHKSREIRELRFYWTVGLVLLVLGIVIYKKLNRWFGLTLIIAGLAEFIYWTSPTFFGGTREFDRLLWNKLVLSLVSLLLLIVVIGINRVFAAPGKNREQNPAAG